MWLAYVHVCLVSLRQYCLQSAVFVYIKEFMMQSQSFEASEVCW